MFAALPALTAELPATVINGRFFYQPIVGAQRLRVWLDTDGGGFVTKQCVERLGLTASDNHVTLPEAVVAPTASGGRLPVIDPDPTDKIFDGLDAQFGATWFAGRIVSLDYPRQRLQLLATSRNSFGALGKAPLQLVRGYPRVEVTIEGRDRVTMSFDTAATVALVPSAQAIAGDRWGAVRATSFLTHAAMRSWHAAHPSWRFIASAGGSGIDMLQVPGLTVGTYHARDVWFTTRPDDDVFDGESVTGKIGPTAYAQTRVTLDYPAGEVYFDE